MASTENDGLSDLSLTTTSSQVQLTNTITNTTANQNGHGDYRWVIWAELRQLPDLTFWRQLLDAVRPPRDDVPAATSIDDIKRTVYAYLDSKARNEFDGSLPVAMEKGMLQVYLFQKGPASARTVIPNLEPHTPIRARYRILDEITGEALEPPPKSEWGKPAGNAPYGPSSGTSGPVPFDQCGGGTFSQRQLDAQEPAPISQSLNNVTTNSNIHQSNDEQRNMMKALISMQQQMAEMRTAFDAGIPGARPEQNRRRIDDDHNKPPPPVAYNEPEYRRRVETAPPPGPLRRVCSLSGLGPMDNVSAPTRKPPKLNLNPFSGNDLHLPLDKWIDEYQICMESIDYGTDTDLIKYLPLYLQGAARTWYVGYLKQQSNLLELSWAQVVEDFMRNFQPEDPSICFARFAACKQKPEQSLISYANELEHLLRRAFPGAPPEVTNQHLVMAFLQNVNSDLRQKITTHLMIGKPMPRFADVRNFVGIMESMRMEDSGGASKATVSQVQHGFGPPGPVPFPQPVDDYDYSRSLNAFGYQGQPMSFPTSRPLVPVSYNQRGTRSQDYRPPAPVPYDQRGNHRHQQDNGRSYGNAQRPAQAPAPYETQDTGSRQQYHGRRQSGTGQSLQPHPVTRHVYDLDWEPKLQPWMVDMQCDTCQQLGHVKKFCPNDLTLLPCDVCNRRFGHYGRRCPALRQYDLWQCQRAGQTQSPVTYTQQVTATGLQEPSATEPAMGNTYNQPDGIIEQQSVPSSRIGRITASLDCVNEEYQLPDCPEIVIGIEGKQYPVVIDTGAQVTVISSRLYKEINPQWNGKCSNRSPVNLCGFDGKQLFTVLGSEDLKLTFGTCAITHSVIIVNDPTGSFTMLIGQDISQRYESTLCWKNKSVTYNSGPLNGLTIPFHKREPTVVCSSSQHAPTGASVFPGEIVPDLARPVLSDQSLYDPGGKSFQRRFHGGTKFSPAAPVRIVGGQRNVRATKSGNFQRNRPWMNRSQTRNYYSSWNQYSSGNDYWDTSYTRRQGGYNVSMQRPDYWTTSQRQAAYIGWNGQSPGCSKFGTTFV